MIVYKTFGTRKIDKTDNIKKDKSTRFADMLIQEVNYNRYRELEKMRILLRDMLKHSEHMQNKRLIEKWIVETEIEQGINH